MSSLRDRVLSKWWIALGVVLLFSAPDLARNLEFLPLLTIQQGIVYGMAAVGLNLLLRHTKLVSFGHAAFFGTGAYTVALLAATRSERLFGAMDVSNFAVLLLAAIVASAIVAAIIGFLSLRHVGLYFSLLTLAFGQLLFAIVNNHNALLGGSDGLSIRPGDARRVLLFGNDLGSDAYGIIFYYVTAVLLILMLYVMYRIINSPFGNALDAIGQDRTRAEFIGLPVQRYFWVAFVISGIYAGIGGAMFAITQQFINPGQTLFFLRSGDILFMAILGGFQTLIGPVVGGVVIEFLVFIGEDLSEQLVGTALPSLAAGVVLIILIYAFPKGVIGSIQQGGSIRNGAARLRRNPSVVGEWANRIVSGAVDAARRSVKNIRVLLFGVK